MRTVQRWAISLLAVFCGFAWAAPGDLDATFGTGGTEQIDFGKFSSVEINASAVQADGKIVVGGSAQVPGRPRQPFVGRYNFDGTVDTTFGVYGWLFPRFNDQAPFPDADRSVRAIAIGTDGDILAVTDVLVPTSQELGFTSFVGTYLVSRNGFPNSLIVNEDWSSGFFPKAVAVHSGGYLVTGIFNQYGMQAYSDTFVMRLDYAGNRDWAFGSSGHVVVSIGSADDEGRAVMAAQYGGRFFVARETSSDSLTHDMFVARFLDNGSLNPAFGNNGVVVIDFAGNDDFANA